MGETSKELIRQLEKLTAQAEAVRKREVAGVISRIKEAIEAYEITASDLGYDGIFCREYRGGAASGADNARRVKYKDGLAAVRPATERS